MDTCDTGLVLLALLLTILHSWFAAAMTAAQNLGSQLGSLAEKQPKLLYYQKKELALQYGRVAELIFSTAAMETLALLFAGFHGWIPFRIAIDGQLWLNPLKLAVDTTAQVTWEQILCIIAAALAGLLLLLLADAFGRGVGRRDPERVAVWSLGYLRLMMTLLFPLRMLYMGVNFLFGGKRPDRETVTEEDILHLVNAGNEDGVIEEQQREMINNIFEFDDILVSEVMTHRKEVTAIDVEMEISQVVELARNEKYSRMPVYQENIDNVIGVLNAKDLLGLIGCPDITAFRVRDLMREALFVPETAKCNDVMADMLRKKMQMAIVVDEYGGTAGILCMEDMLEEIVGNIQDEYDEEESEVRQITDHIYTINGNADPDDVFPKLGCELPEEQAYDTMSGFVVELLGRIPEAHERPVVQWRNLKFTVLAMEDNWISRIKVEILPEETAKSAEK